MDGTGGEAARKLLHVVATVGAATVVALLPPVPGAAVLAAATAVALLVEAVRLSSGRLNAAFQAAVGTMLREGERRAITGATTLSVGFTLTALAFTGPAAFLGILMGGIGDAAAAVVGRRWGGHRYAGGKSLEGSAAFLVTLLALGLALGLGPWTAASLAVVVTLVEAVPLPLHDNLYVPVAAAAVAHLSSAGPALPFFS